MTALATLTLLFGILIGFFVGRTYADTSDDVRSAPLTVPERSTTTARPPGDTVPQNPQGPASSAPPGTELEPTTLGSFDNPVPTGQAYVLGLYEIEVLAADRDAGPELVAFDPGNAPPPPGHQHVLVELAVRFTDANGLGSPAAIPFFVSDGSGRWFAFDSTCGHIPDDLAEVGIVEEGDDLTGQVCFTVPGDAADDLLFGTDGFAGPLYFALPG